MAFVSAKLNEQHGYVYEFAPDGSLAAIVFTGTVTDDVWGDWVGAFRLEGDELAAMPAEVAATANTPDDPRYQAIMGWLMTKVKAKHAELTELYTTKPTETPRPAEEVAQLPQITPEMLDAV